jgi:hypothetical protein
MKKKVLAACFGLSIASASAASAWAATTHTENFTTDYVVVSSKTVVLSADHTITASEFQGISRSDRPGGAFDNMTARCLGTNENNAGAIVTRGSCTEMYPDGSQTFTSYLSQSSAGGPATGVHTFLGGSGKFAGISGKADYTVQPVKSPETTYMFIVRHKATYTLP